MAQGGGVARVAERAFVSPHCRTAPQRAQDAVARGEHGRQTGCSLAAKLHSRRRRTRCRRPAASGSSSRRCPGPRGPALRSARSCRTSGCPFPAAAALADRLAVIGAPGGRLDDVAPGAFGRPGVMHAPGAHRTGAGTVQRPSGAAARGARRDRERRRSAGDQLGDQAAGHGRGTAGERAGVISERVRRLRSAPWLLATASTAAAAWPTGNDISAVVSTRLEDRSSTGNISIGSP